MKSIPIYFFSEDTSFILRQKNKHRVWLQKIIHGEKYKIDTLNYIFCSDAFLHKMNIQYLKHDEYTDIITFDLRETRNSLYLTSDMYISIDRVKENAKTLKEPFYTELRRVMVHGVLHLMGYSDKTNLQKSSMRQKETSSLYIFEKVK